MRILPVVIGAALVALALRATEIYQSVAPGLAFAQAQQQPSQQQPPRQAPPAAGGQPAAATPRPAQSAPAQGQAPAPASAQTAAAPRPTLDPDQLTATEIEVLQDLATRRATLDQRALEIERRE